MKVAVIGAGILGTSVAFQLTRQGADVRVFDERAGAAAGRQSRFRRHDIGIRQCALVPISAVCSQRPLQTSTSPIAGFLSDLPNVYALIAHPGVILAPFLSRAAADEIINGKRSSMLGEDWSVDPALRVPGMDEGNTRNAMDFSSQ